MTFEGMVEEILRREKSQYREINVTEARRALSLQNKILRDMKPEERERYIKTYMMPDGGEAE